MWQTLNVIFEITNIFKYIMEKLVNYFYYFLVVFELFKVILSYAIVLLLSIMFTAV